MRSSSIGTPKPLHPLQHLLIAQSRRFVPPRLRPSSQEYKNIEVVIVDDGSPLPEAQQYLAQLDQEFKEAAAFKLKGRLMGRIARQDQRGPGAGRNLASTLVCGGWHGGGGSGGRMTSG